jgi:ATP-dependent protease HslVU (ClpYQ) peptidase subunit
LTVIAGLVHRRQIWMGSDSAGCSGNDLSVRKDPKIFVKDGFIFGFTSSFRMGQLLHYKLEIPKQMANQTVEHYMATTFVDAVRQCLKDGGYARTENGVETGGWFLVGHEGRLFCVMSDYQVAENVVCFNAIGSGEDFAKGSLDTTQDLDMHPRERILRALKAAEAWSTGVRSPFCIECLEG